MMADTTSATTAAAAAAAAASADNLFPERAPMTEAQIAAAVQACLTVQKRAMTVGGKRPFGAVLVAPDNETVVLTHQSVDQVNHAESSLARLAYTHFPKSYLWRCTLVSTWEPCAMCTSTTYWAHIGRIVFAATNEDLLQLTGPGNRENFTMDWSCRDVLKGCPQKPVEVIGPVPGMAEVVIRESDKYWSVTRKQTPAIAN